MLTCIRNHALGLLCLLALETMLLGLFGILENML